MKRIFCMTLVLLMLFPMMMSCKKDEAPAESDSEVVEKIETAVEEVNLLDTIPVANYGGKTFLISAQGEHEYEFTAEELNGDLANDTLYKWFSTINNRYGVSVESRVPDGEFYEAQSVETMSGTVETSIYAHNAFQLYVPVLAGLYKNWNDMGTMIDLTAPRWDQEINKASTYNGKLFGLSGQLSISKMLYAMATFYNVELLDEIGYDEKYLYQLVDSGEWTLDMLELICKDVYIDVNNNKRKDLGDTFGYLSRTGNSLDIWVTQFNMAITARDTANTITPTLYTEENVDIVKRLCEFYYNNTGIAVIRGETDENTTEAEAFRDNMAAMVTCRFSRATMFAELGVDFYGILPGVKLNDAQTDYYTSIHDRYAIYGVSKNVLDEDKDFIAHITDALCAESSQTVYPQYYDVLLKQRYSKDPDTARMVDLIMKNVRFDTAFQFGKYLEYYPYLVRELIWANNSNLASSYDSMKVSLANKLQDVYRAYQ